MKKINIRTLITIMGISLLFFLASCRTTIHAPQIIDRTPDIIKKPTQTTVINPTVVDIPQETILKTSESKRITAVLGNETTALIPKGILEIGKPKEVILPKNTEVLLPESTSLKTVAPIKVIMESGSEVTLPAGTEITVTKINWYAILFYIVLIVGVGWYYFHLRRQPEDMNNDGFVDDNKVVGKKKLSKKQ